MESKERDNLVIEVAREHLETAREILKGMTHQTLGPDQSQALLKPRTSGLNMIPRGLNVIERYPELLGAGFDPNEVRRVGERQDRMRMFASVSESFALQMQDTVRQDEVFLYRAVMTAYAVGKQAGGNGEILQFVADMKKAMANGPRHPRKIDTRIENPASIE
jgi:hypothetical protein